MNRSFKITGFFTLLIFFVFPLFCQAQTYNDGIIEYDIILSGDADTLSSRLFKNAYMILYVRGQQTRTELHTSLGNTITIYDEKKGNAVILSEYGGQRVMVRLSPDQYKSANKKYLHPVVTYSDKGKVIYGFDCKTAQMKFSDGTSFYVYISPEIKFQTLYNGLPAILQGFPLEYESDLDGLKVIYKVRKIKKDAVIANLFTVPDEGYREVKFEDIYKQ
jgi:hypothetical protein